MLSLDSAAAGEPMQPTSTFATVSAAAYFGVLTESYLDITYIHWEYTPLSLELQPSIGRSVVVSTSASNTSRIHEITCAT